MVRFDNGPEFHHALDGKNVSIINVDLTSSLDLTETPRLRENADIAFVGSQKIGAFDIPALLAQKWLALPLNPNGHPNSDVIKPSMNGSDVMGRSRNAWIIDFGVGMTEADAALYEQPFDYIRTHVYPERLKNNRASYTEKWWQHGEARAGMRAALRNLSPFIVTSRVAKHRVFTWLQSSTLPDHKLCVIARADDYFFGVLHARAQSFGRLRKPVGMVSVMTLYIVLAFASKPILSPGRPARSRRTTRASR